MIIFLFKNLEVAWAQGSSSYCACIHSLNPPNLPGRQGLLCSFRRREIWSSERLGNLLWVTEQEMGAPGFKPRAAWFQSLCSSWWGRLSCSCNQEVAGTGGVLKPLNSTCLEPGLGRPSSVVPPHSSFGVARVLTGQLKTPRVSVPRDQQNLKGLP